MGIKTFDEFCSESDDISEQAIAIQGDWSAKDDLGSISTFMLEKVKWKYLVWITNQKVPTFWKLRT